VINSSIKDVVPQFKIHISAWFHDLCEENLYTDALVNINNVLIILSITYEK